MTNYDPEKPMDFSHDTDEVRENNRAYALADIRSSAHWFFWIAGLSIINTLITAFSSSDISFLAGLGITQLINGLITGLYGENNMLVAVINLLIAGIFIFIGIKARQAIKSAFIIGLILYGLDALIFLGFGIWLPFLFHCFVSYMIFKGMRQVDSYQAM